MNAALGEGTYFCSRAPSVALGELLFMLATLDSKY
jgi:hypothetical protein